MMRTRVLLLLLVLLTPVFALSSAKNKSPDSAKSSLQIAGRVVSISDEGVLTVDRQVASDRSVEKSQVEVSLPMPIVQGKTEKNQRYRHLLALCMGESIIANKCLPSGKSKFNCETAVLNNFRISGNSIELVELLAKY